MTNAVATESRIRGGRSGGGDIHVHGNITLYPSDPNMAAHIRSHVLAGGGW